MHRSALKFPERTAVVDGDIRLAYADMDARSSRFGHWLLKTIGSSRQIGMLCQNSADMAIEYILQHAEMSAVVVDEQLRADPALAAMLDRLGLTLVLTLASATAASSEGQVTTLAAAESGQDSSLPEMDISGQEAALIMYTSGTTGHPKGAVHSHASLAAAVMGNMSGFEITHEDVFPGVLPRFHCAQHCLVATVHAAGGCVVLLRGFIPDAVRASIQKEKYTAFTGLPMVYGALLADPQFRCDDTMRPAIYAMTPVPLIKQIAARMSSNVQLATGQTEMYRGTMTFRPLNYPELDANLLGCLAAAQRERHHG